MSGPLPGDFGVVATPWPSRLTVRSFGGWLIGWLIRWATRSAVNHAVIYMGDGLIGESLARGFVVHPAPARAFRWSTGCMPLTDEDRRLIVAHAQHMADERIPYGYLDIAALALSTRGIHFRWVFRRLNDRRTSICSQAVALCYAAAAITLCAGKFPCEVTPGDCDDVRLHRKVPAFW